MNIYRTARIIFYLLVFLIQGVVCTFADAHLYDTNEIIALAEMQSLSSALDMCQIDTTYYVSLETLNDIGFSTTPAYDFLNNEGGTYIIRPEEGEFRQNRIDLLTAFFPWQGPYITYQSGRTQTGAAPYDQGSPLDPWGNPYLFYSPLGLIRGDTGQVTLDFHGDQFDRYTIASLGKDGVVSSDDLFRQFGGSLSTIAISSVRGSSVTYTNGEFSAIAGSDITIRGYGFGNSQGSSYVTLDSTQLTNITRWTSREIDVTLPSEITGEKSITVHIGVSTSNSAAITISTPPTSVTDWEFYQ